MTLEKYEYYLNKALKDFKDLIDETQTQLDKSETKGEDLYILNLFWRKFINQALDKWNDTSTLLLDDEAMMPMPESVAKQFCTRLFTINNLNLLYELPISEGFEDYEYYEEFPYDKMDSISKEDNIKWYNERFANLEASPDYC